MIELNLIATNSDQELVKTHLQEMVSEVLAEKINNGVYIEKDGKRLLNKKDLNGFVEYAYNEAQKLLQKGEKKIAINGDKIMSWCIHYFEEDDIIGTLYNEDGTNILLQEYVKESAGTDIRAFVVGSRVVASMKRQSLDDDFRSNLHKGGEGTSVKLTAEEKRIVVKAAKVMGLHVAGVDLMRSERGPLVLEVNASPGFGIEKVTGRNVAEKIIEYIEHNASRKNSKDRIGA